MNIKSFIGGRVCIELSRRNIKSLLAKLNGHPPSSRCTLVRPCENGLYLEIKAVENDTHYSKPDREPEPMHPSTEAQLRNMKGGMAWDNEP